MDNVRMQNTAEDSGHNLLQTEDVYSESLLNLGLHEVHPQKQTRSRSIAYPITTAQIHLLDQILEGVFSCSDLNTLKQSRMLSSRFHRFATNELVKRTWITLNLKLVGESFIHNEDHEVLNLKDLPSTLQTKSQDTYFISTLVRGLNFLFKDFASFWTQNRVSGNYLKNLFGLIHKSPNFPCESFNLTTRALQAPISQQILGTIGTQIRKLKLELNFWKQTVSFDESNITTCLRQLLTFQAPNLSLFDCYFSPPKSLSRARHWEWQDSMAEYDRNPNIYFFNFRGQTILKNLNFFRVVSVFWGKVFHEIMEAGVNLKCVVVNAMDASSEKRMLEYFEGENEHRIKLLRSLRLSLCHYTISTYERLISLHGRNVQLRSLGITLHTSSAMINDNNYKSRLTQIINSILESSSKTLKLFRSDPLRLLSGIQIPSMPNLTSFLLLEWKEQTEVEDRLKYFFPPKFNMAEKFNLEQLIIQFQTKDRVLKNADLFRYLDLPQPVHSIKRIYAPLDLPGIPDSVRDFASNFFPNARFLPVEEYCVGSSMAPYR